MTKRKEADINSVETMLEKRAAPQGRNDLPDTTETNDLDWSNGPIWRG